MGKRKHVELPFELRHGSETPHPTRLNAAVSYLRMHADTDGAVIKTGQLALSWRRRLPSVAQRNS